MPLKQRIVARPAVIDCDPGVDDALALALARVSPELDVLAVTTVHGNVPARWSFRNARRFLTFLQAFSGSPGHCPPVHRGAGRPLRAGRVNRSVSLAIHGEDGLGDLFTGGRKPPRLPKSPQMSAHELIAALARRMGERLTLVALGPLTNLAKAAMRDPEALAGVARIVVMGGVAQMPGNASAAAEFNVHCDPEAASVVFGCGAPVTLVGLDVTRRALLPSRLLRGGGPFRRALRSLTRPCVDFSRRFRGVDAVTLHDPLALAVAVEPGLVRCERRPVAVECGDGPARGMTVVDLRPEAAAGGGRGAVEVALDVDGRRFLRFFLSRMGKYRGWA